MTFCTRVKKYDITLSRVLSYGEISRITHKCSYNKRKMSERRNKHGKMIEDNGNALVLLNTVNVI